MDQYFTILSDTQNKANPLNSNRLSDSLSRTEYNALLNSTTPLNISTALLVWEQSQRTLAQGMGLSSGGIALFYPIVGTYNLSRFAIIYEGIINLLNVFQLLLTIVTDI